MGPGAHGPAPMGPGSLSQSFVKFFFGNQEFQWDQERMVEWHKTHVDLPILFLSIYLMMIFWLKPYMEQNEVPPWFGLVSVHAGRWIWGIWNLLLAVFSILGASRCVPHLLSTLWKEGFKYTICGGVPGEDAPDHGAGWYTSNETAPGVGLWVCLFIYSKMPELVDTVFLVFQKKPVIFLHWFHHVTVLLYCWHAYHHEVSTGLWFAGMNYFVHSVMYSYYFVMCTPNFSPTIRSIAKAVAPVITTIQILQMVGGMVVTIAGALYTFGPDYFSKDSHCDIDRANITMGLTM
eukprot:SAG22_NODE_1385_length_4533_cov_11.714253_1_plen_291_part_00